MSCQAAVPHSVSPRFGIASHHQIYSARKTRQGARLHSTPFKGIFFFVQLSERARRNAKFEPRGNHSYASYFIAAGNSLPACINPRNLAVEEEWATKRKLKPGWHDVITRWSQQRLRAPARPHGWLCGLRAGPAPGRCEPDRAASRGTGAAHLTQIAAMREIDGRAHLC